ncbi:MAG: hypothetical protein RRB13_11975 [bacterium]|nr:hypothetical protein [bacterium]
MFKYVASLFALTALMVNLGLSVYGCTLSSELLVESDGLAALQMICGAHLGDEGQTSSDRDPQEGCEHCFSLTNTHLAFGSNAPLVSPAFLAVLAQSSAVELTGTPAPRQQLPPRAPPV